MHLARFAIVIPPVWAGLLAVLQVSSAVQLDGPLRTECRNPRYFVDASGKPVYLAGMHDGWELQDYAWGDANPGICFDFSGFLDALVRYRQNVFRLWCVEHTKINEADSDLTTPLPYHRVPGHGQANDGQPRFDLDQFNQAYFDRLRDRAIQAQKRGVYVIVMLFQGWSIEDKGGRVNPWPYHPFHRGNNVNQVDGDLDGDGQGKELHTYLGEDHALTRRQRAYVRKVIDTLGDLDNVLYEIANESHPRSIQWQSCMVRYIHQVEKSGPKRHPVGITVPFGVPNKRGLNAELFNSPADWISPNHEAGQSYSYRDNPPPADGRKVVISDSDHLFGNQGKDPTWVWKSFCRGYNLLYMDQWTVERDDRDRRRVRAALGHTRVIADRMDLIAVTPHDDLASTKYCLANPGREYLVYAPHGAAVSVDLSAASGTLAVEWLHPITGRAITGGTIRGGARSRLTAPFDGDAVLYIRAEGANP